VQRRPRLGCARLEDRTVPTVNLILDFDGGLTPDSPSYNNISGTITWQPFVPFLEAAGVPGNRTEQVLQIVAGVRADFADFDFQVIWDDRGVNSPFFGPRDAVMMVTNTKFSETGLGGGTGTIGLAPLDLFNDDADAAVTFVGSIAEFSGFDVANAIADTVATISHEFGHSLGQSHVATNDSEAREMMAEASSANGIDQRFTPEPLDHLDPEPGVIYSERERLQRNVGLIASGKTIGTLERLTGQTLFLDTPTIGLDGQGIGVFRGPVAYTNPVTKVTTPEPLTINFAGDRDAFRITLQAGVSYNIRQRAAGSSIDPIFSIWDANSRFLATGTQGAAGGVSVLTFTPSKSGQYYIVAGTGYDRAASGGVGTPSIGGYHLEITPTWFEINSVTNTVVLPGTGAGNVMSAGLAAGGLQVLSGANTIVLPTTYVTGVEFAGAAGNDVYTVDFAGGAFRAAVNDTQGNNRMVVDGSAGDDAFTIAGSQVTTGAGGQVNLAGLSELTVNGRDGNDSFVFSALGLPVTLNGNAPTTTPGDRLVVTASDAKQTAAGPNDGLFTFKSGQPMVYSGMESVTISDAPPPPPPPPLPVDRGSLAIASGAGSLPMATLFNNGTGIAAYTVMAYAPEFRGGVRVAAADVDGDGVDDLITAAGPGGGPHVQVFNGRLPQQLNAPIGSFFAYAARFTGGVNVAAGDINGDGRADIVTGADTGGGPHVRVFDGATGAVLTEFFAYSAGFFGGVRVACADVNADGFADIITAAGPGGGPHVRVFHGVTGEVITEFFAYEATFTGGVFVTAGDVTGDGRADIVTGPGEGGGPIVAAFDGAGGGQIGRFAAYPPGTPGITTGSGSLLTGDSLWASGVRVALADTDANGIRELYTAPGRGRAGTVKGYLLFPFTDIYTRGPNDPTFLGGVYVGS